MAIRDMRVKNTSAIVDRSLWALVLSVILIIGGYSLYVIARHQGVPPLIALGMSTVFDGTAILAAKYSVRYAEEGLNGSFPRTVVRVFALLTAYIQTFHAITKDGLSKSWILWASLPIAAMLVYEIHIRWAKRGALIAGGSAYATPLPAFGLISWILNPLVTFGAFRQVVESRREAILAKALERPALVTETRQLTSVKRDIANRPPPIRPALRKGPARKTVSGHRDAPVLHIREWAKEHGYELGTVGRIPRAIITEYQTAMSETG